MHDASVTVDERLVLDEKPSVLPVLETRPHFQFERDTTLHPLRAIHGECAEQRKNALLSTSTCPPNARDIVPWPSPSCAQALVQIAKAATAMTVGVSSGLKEELDV
jgi:hypothetical protein